MFALSAALHTPSCVSFLLAVDPAVYSLASTTSAASPHVAERLVKGGSTRVLLSSVVSPCAGTKWSSAVAYASIACGLRHVSSRVHLQTEATQHFSSSNVGSLWGGAAMQATLIRTAHWRSTPSAWYTTAVAPTLPFSICPRCRWFFCATAKSNLYLSQHLQQQSLQAFLHVLSDQFQLQQHRRLLLVSAHTPAGHGQFRVSVLTHREGKDAISVPGVESSLTKYCNNSRKSGTDTPAHNNTTAANTSNRSNNTSGSDKDSYSSRSSSLSRGSNKYNSGGTWGTHVRGTSARYTASNSGSNSSTWGRLLTRTRTSLDTGNTRVNNREDSFQRCNTIIEKMPHTCESQRYVLPFLTTIKRVPHIYGSQGDLLPFLPSGKQTLASFLAASLSHMSGSNTRIKKRVHNVKERGSNCLSSVCNTDLVPLYTGVASHGHHGGRSKCCSSVTVALTRLLRWCHPCCTSVLLQRHFFTETKKRFVCNGTQGQQRRAQQQQHPNIEPVQRRLEEAQQHISYRQQQGYTHTCVNTHLYHSQHTGTYAEVVGNTNLMLQQQQNRSNRGSIVYRAEATSQGNRRMLLCGVSNTSKTLGSSSTSNRRPSACCSIFSPVIVPLQRVATAASRFSSAAATTAKAGDTSEGGSSARATATTETRQKIAFAAIEKTSGMSPLTKLPAGSRAGKELPDKQLPKDVTEQAAVHGEEFPWRAAMLACCACMPKSFRSRRLATACEQKQEPAEPKTAGLGLAATTITATVTLVPTTTTTTTSRGSPTTPASKRENIGARTQSDAIGKPLLGGPWTLVDSSGRLRSSSDFEGKYVLLYFGFSFCPDICPQELEKMAQVVERIDKEFGEVVQPMFITVDPKRDTVAQVQAYCREFHPRLLGFTGTQAQIKDVTRRFRVYYNEGIRSTEDDYLVDHSIIQYFLGRDGKFKDFFGKNMTAREIGDKVASYIRRDLERERKKRGGSE